MVPLRRAVGLALVVLASLAACAGETSLRPSEYRRVVRSVCESTAKATQQLGTPKGDDTPALVGFGRRTLAIQRDALREIQALDAPTVDEPRVGRWLDLIGQTLDTAESSLAAQRQGDLTAAARSNAEGADSAARADVIARELGLAVCSTTP